MPIFIIDIESHDAKKLKRKLERLKSTNEMLCISPYHYDTSYTQIVIDTNKTEEDMDEWLYKYSNVDYVGICTQK